MQKPDNIGFMPVNPDINKFPDVVNPFSEHVLSIDFEKPVDIMYMTENDQPVGCL